MRTHRYQQIADALRHRIDGDEFAAGGLLPSEAALCAEYEASRVTVRRALETLRDESLASSRQGVGWYVASEPLRQSLGRLGTIESQLADSGVASGRRVVGFEFVDPPETAATHLGPGPVLRVERVNLADGEPFARVIVWCPEELGAGLSRADVEARSFYDLLPERAGVPVSGAVQTIGADLADDRDVEVLGVRHGAPMLRCLRLTRSAEDEAVVLVSEHRFPAHRTEFVVDLPRVESSISPSGLRLVEGA